jgi:hypothetical protein
LPTPSNQPLLKSNTQVLPFENPALRRVSLDQNLPKCYNTNMKTKKEEIMQFFLVSSGDGSVVLQAIDQEHAFELADEYDFDWDTIEPIEVYFTEETGE